MKSVKNQEGRVLIPYCQVANTSWTRMRGLLGQKSLAQGHGLWIEPANSIHTFFMAFAIDAIFLDRKGTIISMYEAFPPWRHTWIHWRAWRVLELPSGEVARLKIRQGEVLTLC